MLHTLLLVACAASTLSDDHGLERGTPVLQSVGPLAFGPAGILFVGDSQGAAVHAIATGEADPAPGATVPALDVSDLGAAIAGRLGTDERDVLIHDLAVHPRTGTAYLAVSRGRGPDAQPVLLRVRAGQVEEFATENVLCAKVDLPNAPEPGGSSRRDQRSQSITDIGYVDGRVFVAGLSNEEFASKLRAFPFPFPKARPGAAAVEEAAQRSETIALEALARGASVEIFHAAHGAFETRSPVRTFVAYDIAGAPHLLAAYTCTPLVKFPVSDLLPGRKVRGVTVAELGNRNRPIDMVVYEKGGERFLLIANSSRGVMKVTTKGIEDATDGLQERVEGGATAGLHYETLDELRGVTELAKLDEGRAVIVVVGDDGVSSLRTIDFP